MKNTRKGFTLIELTVVLVITGLLAYAGIQATLNIYKNYLQSRAINTLETQTELVLEQISKRLSIRVRGSTIGKKPDGTIIPTSAVGLDATYTILEWVSYSYESFQDGGWSGIADLDNPLTSTRNAADNSGTIATPGSRLVTPVPNEQSTANQNISDLTITSNNLAAGRASIANQNIGIMFKGVNINPLRSFGYNKTQAQSVGVVTNLTTNNNAIAFRNYRSNFISEQYYLLHTAYAVAPGATNPNGDFDLLLYYNFRPWVGEEYDDANTPSSLLATNVTRFNFTEANGVMALKLCIRDAGRSLSQAEAETTVCKTKAIY